MFLQHELKKVESETIEELLDDVLDAENQDRSWRTRCLASRCYHDDDTRMKKMKTRVHVLA